MTLFSAAVLLFLVLDPFGNIPFFLSAVALNWFLAGSARVRRWIPWLERAAGAVLLLIGILLFTGRFAVISSYLAQFSPALEVGL